MNTINIEAVRRDTKASSELIHFNNAGASLPPDAVLNSVIHYLKEEATIGGYEAEAKYASSFKNTYSSIAKLINSQPSEIALVESATRAWDRALSSITFKRGDVILTTFSEYISNYIALLQVQKIYGVKVEMISNDPNAEFSILDLKKKMSKDVKLIALTHVPSTNGLINSLDGVSALARENGAYFLLDACQSVGQIQIDVKKIGCDFLAATGRKFLRAPRGTGFLYVNSEVLPKLEPLFLDFSSATIGNQSYQMKEDAKRFENYEANFAGRIGLGVAVDYALALGMDVIEKRIQTLAKSTREALCQINGITVHDVGTHQSGIVTFSIKGHDVYTIAQKLRENKINVSTSNASFAIDLKEKSIPSILRASLHYYNTEEEIAKFKETLKVII